jgi:PII-like signaling protein
VSEAVVLTVYLGERARAGDRFLADALVDVFAAHALRGSVLLRGASGFGAKHGLRSDRLLTLSEDLPVVAVAVDAAERVLAALPDVERLGGGGLVTLERARLLDGEVPPGPEEAKLTVYLGRRAQPGYEPVVALLHRHGVAGATVLLGVDGTLHGARRRARLLGGNGDVPLMVVAVGEAERLAAALGELGTLVAEPFATWERVRVCKRDGRRLADPGDAPSDPPMRQKLTVYASEQALHEGRPLSAELVRRLRAAGAAGATTLRGHWGYHGDHAPHGDRFWQLRRRVPLVTVVVDTPANTARWFEIVDELTQEAGLVTSELLPEGWSRGAAG